MSDYLTHADVPVVRAAGAEAGSSGYSWFLKDQKGEQWQVVADEEASSFLIFNSRREGSVKMLRESFDKLFLGI